MTGLEYGGAAAPATDAAMRTNVPGDDGKLFDEREQVVGLVLRTLDLDAKARLLAGQDMWRLPLAPPARLPLLMSDGPIGVRGARWSADDPSVALPSPSALAATWDPELARRVGRLLAQEARRKGVHLLLAPTVNLHRSPLGGRHFEAYSEDPYLTGRIGAAYVRGVQEGGVGATVKHFVANDAETERFTVDNVIGARALRELYLAPFEMIVAEGRPWAVMAAYNSVNGSTMTEHRHLLTEVLRDEWGFDGCVVSDWMAARDTVRDIVAGLDIAMPGPVTVYGAALAAAVRDGRVEEKFVDDAARNVLRLAARLGLLEGAPPVVRRAELPAAIDEAALAREVARRSFVLIRNEGAALPLERSGLRSLAVIGGAARDVRAFGGGSAQVFPDHVVSPLDGLLDAIDHGTRLEYAVGSEPSDELATAGKGFDLRALVRDAGGAVIGERSLPNGQVLWFPGDLLSGVTYEALHSVELTGRFVPGESGRHSFGTRGLGTFRLEVAGKVLFDGVERPGSGDQFENIFPAPVPRGEVELTLGDAVEVSLTYWPGLEPTPLPVVGFALAHLGPRRDADELIEEAVATAARADVAIVVVATTERVESEGADRRDMGLPGRQDELVERVAAANKQTVVVVNAGSPVEMPWRDDVCAVLLTWFPGQEAGAALAEVVFGDEEPGGRLPTTLPARLADTPVTRVAPDEGQLRYDEGIFIGYRAWDRSGVAPAYPFGHGLGYTDWEYQGIQVDGVRASVILRNTGPRRGREVVQLYASALGGTVDRPGRWLVAFGAAETEPGQTVTVEMALPARAFQIWDEELGAWRTVPGRYRLTAGRSIADPRVALELDVEV